MWVHFSVFRLAQSLMSEHMLAPVTRLSACLLTEPWVRQASLSGLG